MDRAEEQAMHSSNSADSSKKMDVYQSLAVLKEAEKTCITLFYIEDQSIEKIAMITGFAANTVKSHLKRGKEKMAVYLKENGYDG